VVGISSCRRCIGSFRRGDISRFRLVPRRAADRRESPRSTWKEARTPEPCKIDDGRSARGNICPIIPAQYTEVIGSDVIVIHLDYQAAGVNDRNRTAVLKKCPEGTGAQYFKFPRFVRTATKRRISPALGAAWAPGGTYLARSAFMRGLPCTRRGGSAAAKIFVAGPGSSIIPSPSRFSEALLAGRSLGKAQMGHSSTLARAASRFPVHEPRGCGPWLAAEEGSVLHDEWPDTVSTGRDCGSRAWAARANCGA
jgi:hypothetical protein